MSPCPDRMPGPDVPASSQRNDLPPASEPTPEESARVLLIDDHPVMLLGMAALAASGRLGAAEDLAPENLGAAENLCGTDPGFRVVGIATGEEEARAAHQRLRPDVVVLPIRLDGTRKGIEICRWIKSRADSRVVFFTAFARPVDAVLATLAGADALVPRTAPAAELAAAIRGTGTAVTAAGPADILTPREQDILQLVLEGLTNPEIAVTLHVGLPTVKTHMRHILRKLDVTDRRELF